VPLGPFHAWLPPAYAEPRRRLDGADRLMSKMGVYGFLRILLPLFPGQLREWQTPLLCLAVGRSCFPPGPRWRRATSNACWPTSSINHLGYCLLGIFAVVTAGAGVSEHRAAVLDG